MQLTGATISNVKKVKSGEGEHGPWTLYNVQVGDKKYSIFQNSDVAAPQSGQVIAYAEVEERESEKDGKKYTNYTLKKIKWGEESKTLPSAGKNGKEDTPYSMLLSYAKDVVIHHPGSQALNLVDYANAVLTVAAMFQGSLGMASKKPVSNPAGDDKYIQWAQGVKKELTEAQVAELSYIYDVNDIEKVTDRAVQEEIYKTVKGFKEKKEEPF